MSNTNANEPNSAWQELHNRAMASTEEALFAQRREEHRCASTKFREALEYETQALHLIEGIPTLHLSQAILCRSAAALAMDCGEYEQGVRLIQQGLRLNPPPFLKEELESLCERSVRPLASQATE